MGEPMEPRNGDTEEQYLSVLDPEMKALREKATGALAPLWADRMNEEYGPLPQENQYVPSDMLHDPGVGNRAPMASDLLQWSLWLSHQVTGEEGISDEDLIKVAKLALEYTGE